MKDLLGSRIANVDTYIARVNISINISTTLLH
jgi:hypothetical protein